MRGVLEILESCFRLESIEDCILATQNSGSLHVYEMKRPDKQTIGSVGVTNDSLTFYAIGGEELWAFKLEEEEKQGLFASLLSLHISKRIPVSKWTHSEVKEFAGATLGRRLAFNEISDGRSLLTMSDKDLQKYVSSDEVGRVKSRLNEEVEIEGAQLARQRQSLYAPPPTPSEVAEGLELKDALARAIFEHSSSLGIPFDVAILRDADLGHGAFVLSKYLEAVWEQKQALPELMFRREVHVGRVLESLRIVDERPDPPSQSPSMTPEAMMKLILQHETKISNLEHVVAQLAAQVQALSQPKTRRASLLKK